MNDDPKAVPLSYLFVPAFLVPIPAVAVLIFALNAGSDFESLAIVGWVLLGVAALLGHVALIAWAVEIGVRNARR